MRSSSFPLDFMFGMVISASHEMRSPLAGSFTHLETHSSCGKSLRDQVLWLYVVSFRLTGRKTLLAN
jgi:hypothetical protein